jgi:hypothetical protein
MRLARLILLVIGLGLWILKADIPTPQVFFLGVVAVRAIADLIIWYRQMKPELKEPSIWLFIEGLILVVGGYLIGGIAMQTNVHRWTIVPAMIMIAIGVLAVHCYIKPYQQGTRRPNR